MVAAMTDPAPESKTAAFGFRAVPAADKARHVRDVFDSVARRYDLMNDLMSGGLHRLWKAALIDRLDIAPGMCLLDMAGGTGDIAFRVLRQARRRGIADTSVVVCDVNREMLAAGRRRAATRAPTRARPTPAWLCGDAEAVPLATSSVDAYTIAFGLRNVTEIDRALAEARRVLKPGGRFLCLEFSHVAVPFLGALYDRYSFAVLPRLGRLVTGDEAAYRYLVESIRRFPPQPRLARLIAAAGLDQVKVQNLSGGIAALHSAWRI